MRWSGSLIHPHVASIEMERNGSLGFFFKFLVEFNVAKVAWDWLPVRLSIALHCIDFPGKSGATWSTIIWLLLCWTLVSSPRSCFHLVLDFLARESRLFAVELQTILILSVESEFAYVSRYFDVIFPVWNSSFGYLFGCLHNAASNPTENVCLDERTMQHSKGVGKHIYKSCWTCASFSNSVGTRFYLQIAFRIDTMGSCCERDVSSEILYAIPLAGRVWTPTYMVYDYGWLDIIWTCYL